MGNHTDYNGGYVLPAALDKATAVAGAPVAGDAITLYAADFGREAVFSAAYADAGPAELLGELRPGRRAAVAAGGRPHDGLPRRDRTATCPAARACRLRRPWKSPQRCSCSSCSPIDMDQMEIARLCQRAENEFVGVQSGILDQFSSVFGQHDSLLFLDCLTLEHDTVKMGRSDIALVICDSNVKHALTGGDYNTRRAECMAAAAHFGKPLLREVTWEEFVARENELPENQRKRARHVLSEDQRVLAMREAVKGGRYGSDGPPSRRGPRFLPRPVRELDAGN